MLFKENVPYFLTLLFGILGYTLQHTSDRILERPLIEYNMDLKDSTYVILFTNLTSKIYFEKVEVSLQLIKENNQPINTADSFTSLKVASIFGNIPSNEEPKRYLHNADFQIVNFNPGFQIAAYCEISGGAKPSIRIENKTANQAIFLIERGFITNLVRYEIRLYCLLAILCAASIILYILFTKTDSPKCKKSNIY